MEDDFAPWMAGFFDGEGSVGIYRGGTGGGYTLRVQITQNITPESMQVLNEAREVYGGSLSVMDRSGKSRSCIWQCSGRQGVSFLRAIRPWLRLKADQADVALEWWDSRPLPVRGPDGRYMQKLPATAEIDQRASEKLKAMKRGKPIDVVMADAADLVTIDHELHQLVNVKGE